MTYRLNSGSSDQCDCIHMPRVGGVNKKVYFYASHTTLLIRNMPLTGRVRALGSMPLSHSFSKITVLFFNEIFPTLKP